MSDSTDYLSRAVTAAGILTSKWFPPSAPGQWVPNEYWRTPTICTMLVDLMTLTNKVDYTETLENARQAGEGPLTWCSFYDDLTCWGRFFMHAYNYFEAQSNSAMAAPYLKDAQIVYEQLNQAWNNWDAPEYCGGGVWWMRPPPPLPLSNKFKASNSSLGYVEAALSLYLALGDQKYLDVGRQAWDWIVTSQFIDDKGLIWGALTLDCKIDPNNVPVVGLQGNALSPLWGLYVATKNTEYLDFADKIIEGTMSIMVWEGTQILQDRDDAEWTGQSDDWKRQNSGDTPFKGNVANYLGEYTKNLSTLSDPARQQQAAKYAALLRTNADAVWTNYPGAMFSMDWHTLDANYQPIPDADEVNASLQYSGVAVLTAAAMVS